MDDMEEKMTFEDKDGSCKAELFIGGISVCRCRITYDKDNVWKISAWYTKEGYGHKGYGKKTMSSLITHMYALLGVPSGVEYIWNGVNEYVFDWLDKNFGAVSKCPLAVLKNSFEDDKESHQYKLNKNKFLAYFHIG